MPEAAADDPDEDFSELNIEQLMEIPVVVTAARREQKITSVPYAVAVITQEDIRRSGARSVPDALRLSPGMDVADLAFGLSAVSPRGSQGLLSNRVLVLVDGRQIFDSVFGGTLWGSWPFQLEDIERIEVIRGPGGVTWGANAVNGVINIITKDPADQEGATFTAGGGSLGRHKEHLGYALVDEKMRLRVSGEYEASDGFRTGGSLFGNLEDDYKAGRMGLHGIYDAGRTETLKFSAGSALVDGGHPPPPLADLFRRRNSGSQASFLLGEWTHDVAEDNQVTWKAYVNDFQYSPGVHAIDYRYQQLAFQFSQTFKPAEAHTLTWGIDNRVDLVDTTNSEPFMLSKDFVSTDILGAYVQDDWQFAPKWTLSLGGRIDYEFYGGFQPSGRAALAYQLTKNSMLYGAVSRAFQMLPVVDRFVNIPLANGLARLSTNGGVEAESLLAYEIGGRARFFDRLDTNLSLFWHEHDNATTLPPRLGPPALINIDFGREGASSFYGVEFDARYAATAKLTLLGNYTYQQLDWTSDVSYVQRDAITPPKHKFMLGARYDVTDDLNVSSHLYYVDAVKAPDPSNLFLPLHLDPYFRLDLRAEHEFWDDRASVAVGGDQSARSRPPRGHVDVQRPGRNAADGVCGVPPLDRVGIPGEAWARTSALRQLDTRCPVSAPSDRKRAVEELLRDRDVRCRVSRRLECPEGARPGQSQRDDQLIRKILADGRVGLEIVPHLLHRPLGHGFCPHAALSKPGDHFAHMLGLHLDTHDIAGTA